MSAGEREEVQPFHMKNVIVYCYLCVCVCVCVLRSACVHLCETVSECVSQESFHPLLISTKWRK